VHARLQVARYTRDVRTEARRIGSGGGMKRHRVTIPTE
jgi:hypothetical protein